MSRRLLRNLCVCLLSIVAVPSSAIAAITAVSSAEWQQVGDGINNTFSNTFDIGTRTNGCIVVTTSLVGANARTFDDITWNGVSLTLAHSFARTTGRYLSIWFLTAPANGSNTLLLDFDGSGTFETSDQVYVTISWWDGCHQTQGSLEDQNADATGTGVATVNITPTEDNELMVGAYESENNTVLTAGTNETVLQDIDLGPRVAGSAYYIQTTAATEAFDWSSSGPDSWSIVVVSFRAAAAGSTPAACGLLLGVLHPCS